jgi:hypothetical protein
MTANIAREVRALRKMTVGQLRDRYAEVFGEETRSHHKDYLWKRIAWRIQVLAEGDISEAARERARELARDADLRTTAPKEFWNALPAPAEPVRTITVPLEIKTDQRLPISGTELVRHYKGRDIVVTVLEDGFFYEGERYRSLSAIAKAVTGTNWNGFDFFGLRKAGGRRPETGGAL